MTDTVSIGELNRLCRAGAVVGVRYVVEAGGGLRFVGVRVAGELAERGGHGRWAVEVQPNGRHGIPESASLRERHEGKA